MLFYSILPLNVSKTDSNKLISSTDDSLSIAINHFFLVKGQSGKPCRSYVKNEPSKWVSQRVNAQT